ncbi:MAG: RtcB family protein [Rhodospirillales bacterium]|nr:RtcB family protein [Rhodospirillales bacterium]
MDTSRLERVSEHEWRLAPRGAMRVPAVIFADANLIREMDDKVLEQIGNVACLPGIVSAAYAMPDAHWGYGFPVGGVAAFDPEDGGVISAGGVGFDISCGVRTLLTGLRRSDVEPVKRALADGLFAEIPAGLGSRGKIALDAAETDAMLKGGARWAVERGYGVPADLERIEDRGTAAGALPDAVSEEAKNRQREEMGTLGSGNHYLEVQEVTELFDREAADAFGLEEGAIVVSIHCGSRGLGHQIGTEFLREMALAAPTHGIELPDLELACAPIASPLGQRYLGAMRAAINCALANRQIITHLTRKVFADLFPGARLDLLFDVSHNTCKEELHALDGERRRVFVHRKGATRAFGLGHPNLPAAFAAVGQPVFIGGSMGTTSSIMAGTATGRERGFSSACHGAGRRLSRHQALKRWRGRAVVDELAARGIIVRSPSLRGVAEEAPGAYKDTASVVDSAHAAGLARKVATLEPIVCIKG